jgi:hypothetical protein
MSKSIPTRIVTHGTFGSLFAVSERGDKESGIFIRVPKFTWREASLVPDAVDFLLDGQRV